ncbi:hypothetical protein GWI33_012737 [Rhynchophorus ferrugineus]|uniref:Uncharacterized protein n=1 Tax=Rhynchophorus ferrugineus TaxID=354439 RepID=A0A834MLT2_RHYFE|nr:hypothetical protein GWI33_012737 [Rhynchophorus ferrugineus]
MTVRTQCDKSRNPPYPHLDANEIQRRVVSVDVGSGHRTERAMKIIRAAFEFHESTQCGTNELRAAVCAVPKFIQGLTCFVIFVNAERYTVSISFTTTKLNSEIPRTNLLTIIYGKLF